MTIPEKLQALVEQMPDPDKRSMFTTDIDEKKIEKALEEMFRGGRETVVGSGSQPLALKRPMRKGQKRLSNCGLGP